MPRRIRRYRQACDPQRSARRGQGGFTLVELLIGMLLTGVILVMVLSIQFRMSSAFQAQNSASEINMNVRMARQYLLGEMRLAGFGLGVTTGTVGVASGVDASNLLRGLVVHNDMFSDGNDGFTIMYSDGSASLKVDSIGPSQVFANVSTAVPFAIGDVVILAGPTASCLIKITGINPGKVHFNPSGAPYNEAPQNPHCDLVSAGGQPLSIRRAVRRTYRIDPNRPQAGYLQMSPSGMQVADDWVDMGAGFTTMQLASRYYEETNATDADGDGDAERDWYSSNNQAEPDPTAVRPADAILLQVSLSLEVRDVVGSRGARPSPATKAFGDLANVTNNRFGDWAQTCTSIPVCGIDLDAVPSASRPARYQGENIYRSSTTLLDLRNMGVGK